MGRDDWGSGVERAWNTFRARLGDHLAEMDDEESLTLSPTGEGESTFVQLTREGATLHAEATVPVELTQAGRTHEQVLALGWVEDDDSLRGLHYADHGIRVYVAEFEQRHADWVANLVSCTTRDLLGVAHPALLATEEGVDLGFQAPSEPSIESAEAQSGVDVEDAPALSFPTCKDELESLVSRSLAVCFGSEPERDDDGDIPIRTDRTMVFVRVLEHVPVVEMFSQVVTDVRFRRRAEFEVAVLNRDDVLATFVLGHGVVVARHRYVALPFAPEQLRRALTFFCDTVDRVAEDLAARTGGRLFLDEADDGAVGGAERA